MKVNPTELTLMGSILLAVLGIIWKVWDRVTNLEKTMDQRVGQLQDCMTKIKVSLERIETYSKVHADQIKEINETIKGLRP